MMATDAQWRTWLVHHSSLLTRHQRQLQGRRVMGLADKFVETRTEARTLLLKSDWHRSSKTLLIWRRKEETKVANGAFLHQSLILELRCPMAARQLRRSDLQGTSLRQKKCQRLLRGGLRFLKTRSMEEPIRKEFAQVLSYLQSPL